MITIVRLSVVFYSMLSTSVSAATNYQNMSSVNALMNCQSIADKSKIYSALAWAMKIERDLGGLPNDISPTVSLLMKKADAEGIRAADMDWGSQEINNMTDDVKRHCKELVLYSIEQH